VDGTNIPVLCSYLRSAIMGPIFASAFLRVFPRIPTKLTCLFETIWRSIIDEDAKKSALRMIPYGMYVLTSKSKDGKEVSAATVNWLT
jgi:hypothetical protein